jgi:hypothetical protein
MNNKKINLAIIDQVDKPQLKHVPYGASKTAVAVVAVVAVAAPVGMECIAAGTMHVNATC